MIKIQLYNLLLVIVNLYKSKQTQRKQLKWSYYLKEKHNGMYLTDNCTFG